MHAFEVLAHEDTEYKQARDRSIIAAQVRAKEEFGAFLANAGNKADGRSRLAAIETDLRRVVAEIVREYGFDNPEMVYQAARTVLACTCESDDCEDCDCKECHGDKKSRVATKVEDEDKAEAEDEADDKDGDWEKPWEKKDSGYHDHVFKPVTAAAEGMWHVAADPIWEDSYQHERQKLPVSDGDGLNLEQGAVKTDLDKAGDVANNSLPRIDVHSEKHPKTVQDITDRADYNNSDFDPSSPTRERVDAPKPMQPEFTFGPDTQTWSGDAGDSLGQQAPVTSQTLSKYQLVDVLS